MHTVDWWLQKRSGLNKLQKKGLDSTFMLVSWKLWKERNGRVFTSQPENSASQVTSLILEEGQQWIQAGAANLITIGWPTVSSAGAVVSS